MKNITTLLLFVSIFVTGLVYSHSGAKGIVKERMDAMQTMADKSKLVADMFKGKVEFDRNAVVEAADAFLAHGNQMLKLFPDTEMSRTGSSTEALPLIWEEWDEFNDQVVTFVKRSESLIITVTTTDDVKEIRKVFFKTTKSCSDCHKRFRKPKQ